MNELEQLEVGIASLEARRAVLGDAAVDAALTAMRARLDALRAATPSLRHVSVLFLHVVGATALAADLEPEDAHELLDDTLQHCGATVVAHGGRVLQYAWDGLLAAFGTPQAREDDAERAVHCGLALLHAGRALGERVWGRHGLAGCDLRVGIHTGPVLLGGGVDEEGTIRGMTVNLAARLEQAAPPGRLRISQATWRLVRGVFDAEAQPPLTIKGQDRPLATWLVERARPRALRVPQRGIDGLETPMVGRRAEFDQLCAGFEQLAVPDAAHRPLAVTLVADAGLGKSRLLQEFQHWLDEHPRPCRLLLGRSHASHRLQPYGLLRDLLAWQLQIADSDDADTARRKLVEGLVDALVPQAAQAAQAAQASEATGATGAAAAAVATAAADARPQAARDAAVLGELIGMDFSADPELPALLATPRRFRDRALQVFAAWLRAMARQRGAPLVMLLDDLQWADDASLDALAHLQAQDDLACLTVMAARPTLLERRPDWGQGWPAHRLLRLAELDGAARAELTAALLDRIADAPPELLGLIDRQAGGNPFYAEELVKMLIDDGAIVPGADGWTVHAGRLSAARVPETLAGVLQARLDTLAAPARRALQLASVVGPVFWDRALAEIDAAAPHALPLLAQREMVHLRPDSAFADAREHAFQHHLLHQVTYETVLKGDRLHGHARTAEWLAARVGERSAEYLAVVADHFERAGDPARAFDWYERAIAESARRFALHDTIAYAERALALPPPPDLRRVARMLNRLSSAADVLARRDLQAQALERRLALADQLDDDGLRASSVSSLALLADRLGDRDRAAELARRGVVLAERVGAASDAALCWGELSWLSRQRGDLDAALHEVEAGLVWARRAARDDPPQPMYEMQLLLVLATLAGALHQVEREQAALQQALALAESARELRACGRRLPLAAYGPLLGHLLLRAFERAQRIHLAMRARGFDGQLRSLRTMRWQRRDTAFVLGWCAFFALARAVDLPQALGRALLGVGS